jgi:hypothetical protein
MTPTHAFPAGTLASLWRRLCIAFGSDTVRFWFAFDPLSVHLRLGLVSLLLHRLRPFAESAGAWRARARSNAQEGLFLNLGQR